MHRNVDGLIQQYVQIDDVDPSDVVSKVEYFNDVWGFDGGEEVVLAEAVLATQHNVDLITTHTVGRSVTVVDDPPTNRTDRFHIEVVDDTIHISTIPPDNPFTIGDITDLFNLPNYDNGVFKTENGVRIPIKEFISNINTTPTIARNLKHRPREKYTASDRLTERMQLFKGLLFNKIRANIHP